MSRRALAGAAAGAASGALAFGVLPPVDALLETPTDMLNDPPRVHWSSGNIPTVANGGVNRPKTIAEASEDLSKARKRIAIFGGSFNPITNAHLNCAAEIIHSKLADEVWITPCGTRPDKPSLRTPSLHRLIMCHLAVDTTFGSRFGVKVCDEEMQAPRNIPTIVLMRRLKTRYPNYEFSFVVGSDLIPTLHEWEASGCEGHWEEIPDAGRQFIAENHFLVIDRPGEFEEGTSPLTDNFEMISAGLEARGSRLTETLLSSSEVRRRMTRRGADDIVRYGLRRGGSEDPGGANEAVTFSKSWYDEVEGLVPPSVLGHIVRYGLYSNNAPRKGDKRSPGL